MSISISYGLEGYFNLVIRDASTLQEKRSTGFFKNIITNYGLNALASLPTIFNGCSVGTGNSTPSVSDVALQSQVARTTTAISNTVVISSEAPYYSARVVTFRFAEGAAAGNLSEVGINAEASSPYELWSRALILDNLGNPTTITVLPNEILDVVYECRVYAMENDVSGGPFTLLGVQYNWIMRAIRVRQDMTNILVAGTTNPGAAVAYDGDMVQVTDLQPSGTIAGGSSVGTIAPYVNNSYKKQITYTWTVTQGNGASGIKTLFMPVTDSPVAPYFQVGLDKIFPKSPTNTFSIVFEWSWSRR